MPTLLAGALLALGLVLVTAGWRRRARRVDRRVWHIGTGRQPFLPPSLADDAGSQVGQRPYMPARRDRR
jgi:hypothetical protein